MRVERVGLENHGDVAIARGPGRDILAADNDLAAIGVVEAGDDAQERALAAAGRPDEGDEFASLGLEADTLQNAVAAIGLVDVAKAERAHSAASTGTAEMLRG